MASKRMRYEDRLIIEKELNDNTSVAEIAHIIGVSRTAIYKELKKNKKPYNAEDAQRNVMMSKPQN